MIQRGGLFYFPFLFFSFATRVVEPPKSVVLDAFSLGLTNNVHTYIYLKSCVLCLI